MTLMSFLARVIYPPIRNYWLQQTRQKNLNHTEQRKQQGSFNSLNSISNPFVPKARFKSFQGHFCGSERVFCIGIYLQLQDSRLQIQQSTRKLSKAKIWNHWVFRNNLTKPYSYINRSKLIFLPNWQHISKDFSYYWGLSSNCTDNYAKAESPVL